MRKPAAAVRDVRHDLLAADARLECLRRVAETAGDLTGAAAPVGGHRLVAVLRRQLERTGGFWGAHTGPNPTDRAKAGVKHHVATDGQETPLVVDVTPANVYDSQRLLPLIDAIPFVQGPVGAPHRPARVCADKAYDSRALRDGLRSRHIVPELARRRADEPPLGCHRWIVERTIAWYRQFRRLRVCYEKRPDIHYGFLDLATAAITFRKWRDVFC